MGMMYPQNSTLLWEVLEGHVMDHCLSLHHRIMREVGAAVVARTAQCRVRPESRCVREACGCNT